MRELLIHVGYLDFLKNFISSFYAFDKNKKIIKIIFIKYYITRKKNVNLDVFNKNLFGIIFFYLNIPLFIYTQILDFIKSQNFILKRNFIPRYLSSVFR